MELISIIVPVYNVEKYLLRCVESIQKQTYQNLEIILVDDGSPDRCPKMCDELAAADARIKVVHKVNGGLGFARNSGLKVATGEYVTFVDSDDWIDKTHIENLYHVIRENQADIVVGSHTVVDDTGNRMPHQIRLEERVYKGEDVTNEVLLPLIGPDVDFPQDVQLDSSCWSNLYRLDLIVSHGLQFPSEKHAVAEDLFFNICCLHFAKCVVVMNEVGYFYYENHASISRKYNFQRFERTLNFHTKLYEQIEAYGLENKIAYRADRMFLVKIRAAIRLIVISDLKRKQKLQEIEKILENETTAAVLAKYPIDTLIPALRLLAKYMREKHVVGVYYLMKFRETAKQQRLLKSALKLIGIGK